MDVLSCNEFSCQYPPKPAFFGFSFAIRRVLASSLGILALFGVGGGHVTRVMTD